MSADNILLITHHRGKVRVYDVGFSYISSREGWKFPLTREASVNLTKVVAEEYADWELHKCETKEQALAFCKRYQRDNLVEYGHCSLMTEDEAKAIQKKYIKKKKESKRT